MPSRTGQAIDQLAQCQVLAINNVDDQLEATGLTFTAVEVDQVPRKRRVQVMPGQVDPQHAAQLTQRDMRQDQLIELIEFALGFSFAAGYVRADARQDFQLPWVAPHRPGPGTDVVGELGRTVQRLVRGENRFGMARSKVAAVLGRARLHLHRPALWRARRVEGTLDLVMGAHMVDRMHLAGIGKHPGRLVQHQRVVFPAVPQVGRHLHELFGLGVAIMGRWMLVKAEIGGSVGHGSGHDVPAGAAVADVVQGAERSGQIVGFAVGGTGRGNQADAPGDCGNGRQPGDGLEPDTQALPPAFGK